MRLVTSIVCAGISITLLAGFCAMYWWVPRIKFVALGFGTELPGWQVLLFTLSDITINYFYIVLPALLAICYGLCRVAFASENESSRTES